MKKLLYIILTLSITLTGYARTTYEQIKKNRPRINSAYAVKLAIEIDIAADKYKVPSNVLAGLAMQESSYRLGAVNAKSNDYGLFQINIFNVKAYKFSIYRLKNDLHYSVDAGAKVFSWFYKRYKLSRAIGAYNCGTRKSCVKWKSVKHYIKRVKRFM